jgi:hypothetical protein
VNPALLTATITYTSQEVYTIPNMTGSVSANTGSSATFNVPGGVQYSSWGNPEYFYFNWGDGSASGWVLSSASHTYSSPGTYQVTFQVESSASAPTSAANAWTVTVTGAAASYQGWLDVANCSTIAGWAENTSQINSPLTVSFYVDGAGSASFSTTANQFRQDLLNAGIGTGYYGLSFATPAVLFDGYTLRAVRDNRHAITRESEVRAVRHATDRHNHDNPGRVVGECSWHPEPNVVQSFVPAGISITVGSPQLGAAGTEYVFTGWSDPAGNPLTINAGATVTANFSTYYQFTGIVNPSGGGSILFGNANSQQIIAPPYSSSLPSACLPGGWCPAGTTFWVTGQASSGYGFINLSNGILQQDVIM